MIIRNLLSDLIDSIIYSIIKVIYPRCINYFCEINSVASVNYNAFNDYKDVNIGKDVVVIGAGPTLNSYIPMPSAIHIGVNSTYKRNGDLKFDYFFLQDYGQDYESNVLVKATISALNAMKCTLFYGVPIDSRMKVYTIPMGLTTNARQYYVMDSRHREICADIRYFPLMDYNSVIFSAIQFALFTNPKRIYLVGCDVSDHGHFDNSMKMRKDGLFNILYGYRCLKDFAEKHYPDTEIISINPIGLKGLFTDIYQ